jgi:FkbM family methyltransferase
MASSVPSPLTQKLLRRAESRILRWQGKGYGGSSLADEVRAALAFIPAQGAVLFDVGAHKGEWTRAVLSERPGVAAVHAFEPSAHLWPVIETIGDPRVNLVKQAASDREGDATLYTCAPGSPLASLALRRLDHMGIVFDQTETVETVMLDRFIERHDIAEIAFAKFDIEGYELMAFEGAARALSSHRIRALAFEFGGCNIDTKTYFRDFWRLLTGFGYRIHRIAPGGRLWPVPSYGEAQECFLTTNYLAECGPR